jgi:hypothetical protein
MHLVEAAHSREPLCGLGAHACQGLPGACEHLWGEQAQSAGTDAPGAWCKALAVLAMQDVGWPWWCRAELRGWAVALRAEPNRTARAQLRPFARATVLQSGAHVWAQWCHARPPVAR